jgi:hypothetical protein
MDVVRFYYVAFPDGSMYHEQYCVWEFQEEEKTSVTEEPPPCKRPRKAYDLPTPASHESLWTYRDLSPRSPFRKAPQHVYASSGHICTILLPVQTGL